MTEYAKLVVSVDSTQVKNAEKAISDLGGTSKKTETSAGSLGRTLTRLAAPLAAFLSVRAVINASDQYGQMASRMRQATSSAEEYASVQQRLIDTANRTYRPLAEAQELFIRTADSLKSLGYETNAALDITDSFSYLLVANAASADRAGSAINAYSKAIQTGKVDSESWQSILAAMPTVVDSLAAATGRSTQEIRELGIGGKLSLQALNEALRHSVDVNGQLADKMETSVADAIVTLQNSFQVLIGKTNETSGATSGLVTAIEGMAALLQDPKTVQGLADLATGLVTLTGWLIQGAAATGTFFDELTDGLAGIKKMTQIEAMEQAIRDTTIELNNLQGDLLSPDWMLSIRGLDRGELEARVRSLKLDIQGMQGLLADVNKQEALASVASDLDDVLSKLGGFDSAAGGIVKVNAETDNAAEVAKKLASDYASAVQGLERQIALYGQSGEAARINYELTKGSLQGVVGQQAIYLTGLAKELDEKKALTEQEQLRIQLLRETGQLRAANDAQFELEYAAKIAEYEKQGNEEALKRLETLRRIREVQMNADQAPGTIEGVSQAPSVGGVDAAVGGPGSEMMRLEQETAALEAWRASELERQQGFLDANAINEEQHAERVRNIHDQHQQETANIDAARQQVALSATEDMFGSMADLTRQFAGENSGIYKAMFAAEKAVAIARSMLAIQTGIALAAANPWPTNLAAMATVAANTASIVGNISAVGLSFEGGGYTGNGPRTGGLDGKGGFMAMVHPKETIIDHTKSQSGVSGQAKGQGGQPVTQIFEINGDVSPQTVELVQRGMRETMTAIMRDANQNGPIMQTIRRRM